MSEEEIIKDLTNYISFANKSENFSNDHDFRWNTEISQRVQGLLDLYNKEKERNKEIIKMLEIIRDELKDKIITQDIDGNYKPCKNLTKQEVYKSYVKLRKMLKAEYIFKDNETALQELLEEE